MLKRLYAWMLTWADRPNGPRALAALSFAESSFFPVPPDPLLMALCLGRPKRGFRFAFIASVFSVIGGMAGYAIGYFLWSLVGDWFIAHVPGVTEAGFHKVGALYDAYDFWAVFAAGFSPLPYKLFTLAGGVFQINFPIFVLASAVSRSARFFLEAALLHRYGPPIQGFIERNLGWLSFAFVVLLFGGFLLLKH